MRRGAHKLETAAWLATALTLASTVLGAAALHGYELFRSSDRTRENHVRTIAETYAAQTASAAISGRAEAIEAWLRDLAMHPSVLLVGVIDIMNEPIAVRGNQHLLDLAMPAVESVPDISQPATSTRSSPNASPMPELIIAAVPITPDNVDTPIGRLVCVCRVPKPEVAFGQVGWFFILLGLVAVTGLVLAAVWFRHAILLPLEKLAGKSSKAIHAISSNRNDEIGQVARVIAGLRHDLEHSNVRASHLQRTLRDRVAEETHDITRELRRAERRGWTDPLTRVGNRQLLDDRLEEVFNACTAAGDDLSVIMFDVDNFKPLNDTLGHKAGDELLRFIGELLKQCTREEDLAVRMGGDEFLVVLPRVSADNARAIAERTIQLFGQNARLLQVDPRPAISGGVASLRHHCPSTPAELLQMADAALYASKKAGKSRVSVYEEDHSPAVAR